MNLETFKKIFAQEFEKFQQERNGEQPSLDDTMDDVLPPPSFEDDPIGYILYHYTTLKETLQELLTENFLDYVIGIYIIAPIPTTFKIILHNNQSFYLIYMGRTWMAKVAGKKYYLLNIGEKGRAIESIARLLAMGPPAGLEPSGTSETNISNAAPIPPTGEEAGGEAGGSNPFAEETPTEET